MRRLLIVVDMQKDFIDGALGFEGADKIIPGIIGRINEYKAAGDEVVYTLDTHTEDYMNTQEGKNLPVPHCIRGTDGWHMPDEVSKTKAIQNAEIYEKPTFGSTWLINRLKANCQWDGITTFETDYEFTIVGFCTDICVVSNALLLRAQFPNSTIKVLRDCTAGVTPETHEAALKTMQMCQIEVI